MAGDNMVVAYAVLGVYLLLVLGAGLLGAFMTYFGRGQKRMGLVRGPQFDEPPPHPIVCRAGCCTPRSPLTLHIGCYQC